MTMSSPNMFDHHSQFHNAVYVTGKARINPYQFSEHEAETTGLVQQRSIHSKLSIENGTGLI